MLLGLILTLSQRYLQHRLQLMLPMLVLTCADCLRLTTAPHCPAPALLCSSEAAAFVPRLLLTAGACVIPHPDKMEKGGEDAFFISERGYCLGVADGVGGWAEIGVDPGLYSKELMGFAKEAAATCAPSGCWRCLLPASECCCLLWGWRRPAAGPAVRGGRHRRQRSQPVLLLAPACRPSCATAAAGGCLHCYPGTRVFHCLHTVPGKRAAACLEPGRFRCAAKSSMDATLTDAALVQTSLSSAVPDFHFLLLHPGFMVVRDGELHFLSPQQQHEFNFPYQIGGYGTEEGGVHGLRGQPTRLGRGAA